MVQRTHGIVKLIVVKKRQFVMNLSAPNVFGVIQCCFVQVDRTLKVASRCLVVGILDELIVASRDEAVAAYEIECDKDRQPAEMKLVGALHRRQFAQL